MLCDIKYVHAVPTNAEGFNRLFPLLWTAVNTPKLII